MQHPEGIAIIVPVAHDLAWSQYESHMCGPGTMRACDHALELASQTPYARLFVSAAEAPKFPGEAMGVVMKDYLQARAPNAPITFRPAPYFNTLGEVLAVADYVRELQTLAGPQAVRKVTFAVKDWHAERVRALAEEVFTHYGLDVKRCIQQHDAPGGFLEKMLEPLKTRRQIKFFRDVHLKKEAA